MCWYIFFYIYEEKAHIHESLPIYNRKVFFYIIGRKNIVPELDISYLTDMFYMLDMLYMSYLADMYYQDSMLLYVYYTIPIYSYLYVSRETSL